jgi:hypothetical protein
MRLTHAAALTLMGWYLMVPPGSCKPGWRSDGGPLPCNAPVSEWVVAQSFSLEDNCNAERSNDISQSPGATAKAKNSGDKQLDDSTRKVHWRALTEICISADNPLLGQ